MASVSNDQLDRIPALLKFNTADFTIGPNTLLRQEFLKSLAVEGEDPVVLKPELGRNGPLCGLTLNSCTARVPRPRVHANFEGLKDMSRPLRRRDVLALSLELAQTVAVEKLPGKSTILDIRWMLMNQKCLQEVFHCERSEQEHRAIRYRSGY